VNTAARRALLGDAAITRARQIAEAAPRLDPTDDLYVALAVLLARRPHNGWVKGASATKRSA
jgi:hypothetical protein